MTQPYILQALKAGFPRELLMGIAPPDAPIDRFPYPGKTPAYWHHEHGWTNHKDWETGAPSHYFPAIANHNGNVGIRLGVPARGVQFLACDLDTDGNADPTSPQSVLAANIYRATVKTLTERLNLQSLWVRRTRPDRATILFALPIDAIPGQVSTIHFTHPDGIPAGKLQILAKGQQTVIGGVHAWSGGTPIVWQEMYEGEVSFEDCSFPPIDSIPRIPDRAKLDDLVDDVCFQLEVSLGLTCSRRRNTFSSLYRDDGEPLDLTEQAAWDSQSFKDLLSTMPHGRDVKREEWVKLMLCMSGAIRAAKTLGRVDEIEEMEMGNAAVDWSAKWEGHDGVVTDIEAEQEKWEKDFNVADIRTVGWKQLLHRAIGAGDLRWTYEWACHDFPDITYPPVDAVVDKLLPSLPVDTTLYPDEPVENPFSTGISTSRRNKKLRFDVKKSEIQIADYMETKLRGKCAWIKEEKQWIVWGGPEVSWTTPTATALVETEIQNQLIYYVTQNEAHFGNDDTARASLTSERTVSSMQRLLRSRMTIPASMLDRGDYCIQTPTGAWDLLTGKPFKTNELQRQLGFMDRRMTSVTPKEGPTPLFDNLLDHLACGDQEVVDWLWSYYGYAFIGQPKLHLLLIVHGPGGNGKGTLANTLSRIGGDYVVSLDRRVIVQSGANDHPTGRKRADSKRLWLISELNPRENWDESGIKSMSGGDMISARDMNQNMSEFKPEGSFYIYTQFVPALHRVDESIIRRFRMLHARIKVPEELIDRTMEDKIVEQEGPAILARLIREAKAVIDRNWELVKTPLSMQAEVKRYFAGQDQFALWWHDEASTTRVVGNESDIALDLLYERYKKYNKKINIRNDEDTDDFMESGELNALSLPAFTGALRRAGALLTDQHGRSIRGPGGKAMVRGVRLKLGVVSENEGLRVVN